MPEKTEPSAAPERPELSGRAGSSDVSDPARRRAYQRPRILFREPLEAMASVCAPHPPAKGNPGACPMGPISS
jgi:hypothetical protein